MRTNIHFQVSTLLLAAAAMCGTATAAEKFDYRVLATTKTSTMEKEMNEAADQGFRFSYAMGGDTAIGGKEAVAVMTKDGGPKVRRRYKLLATNKTGTMEKEMLVAGAEGFLYRGQTVFNSTLGGQEVAVILELDADAPPKKYEYRLQATSKTSTMQKELQEAGAGGWEIVGMTVSKTAFGGNELVCIMKREAK